MLGWIESFVERHGARIVIFGTQPGFVAAMLFGNFKDFFEHGGSHALATKLGDGINLIDPHIFYAGGVRKNVTVDSASNVTIDSTDKIETTRIAQEIP